LCTGTSEALVLNGKEKIDLYLFDTGFMVQSVSSAVST